MREPNDSRLTNQLSYLSGAELSWRKYKAPRAEWDHDHCEFCWAKFAETEGPEILHEGFATAEDKWVCSTCFEDFRDLFAWQLPVPTAPQQVTPN
jgi:hypothetical protein